MATYSRGDHLRVGRLPIAGRFLYYHHGIYVGDDRVVQFGGQLWNKPRSGIDEVTLERFSKRGVPEILDHTNLRFPGGMPLPPTYPPERIVARARCLVETQPRGVYNLFGRNCETIALWCVCGWAESLQRQRFQMAWARYWANQGIVLSLRTRRGATPWQLGEALAGIAFRFALLRMYYRHQKRFYRAARACDHR